MKNKILFRICFALVLLFLYIPIIVVSVFAFNDTKSRTVFSGFTLNWFFELMKDDVIIGAFLNSLILAILSAIIATLIGTMAALQIVKMRKKQQFVIMNLNYISIVNSDVVIGVSLMMLMVFFLNMVGGQLGFLTVLIAHITISIPYVVLALVPKIRQTDDNLLNAALDLGCSPVRAFFKVVFPQIAAGIAGAFIMAFSISFDDFAISYFTTGSSFQTLPVLIYSMTRKRITPKINALFALIFILVFLMLLTLNFLDSRSKKPKKRKIFKLN